MLAGYSSGTIAVFNLKTAKLIKTIKCLSKNERIQKLKFLKTTETKKKGFTFFACNEDGKLKRILIKKVNSFGITKYKKEIITVYNGQKGAILQFEPLSLELEEKNIKKTVGFLACTTVNSFFIQYQENPSTLFEIERSSFFKTLSLPIFTLDKSDCENDEIKANFMISWGNVFLKVNFFRNENNWRVKKWLVVDKEIIFFTIISPEVIFAIDGNKAIFLLHFSEMYEGDLKNIDLKHTKDLLKNSFQPKDKETSDLIEFYFHNKIDFSQKCLFSLDFKRSTLYFFINSDIFCLNLVSWERYLQALIDKNEYREAMSTMLRIHKNKLRYLSNIPIDPIKKKEILSNSIKEIAINYFLQNFKKIQDSLVDSGYVKEIATTIEFLIETENFDFLFNNIMRDLELKGYIKHFLTSLEPFIIKKKIRFIQIPLPNSLPNLNFL